MSDTFKLAKNLAKDAIGMSPEIEITKIKLPRRGGGLASLREMPVVYRQSGGPTKLVETDIGLQEMFLGDDGNYYTIDGFDERGLYDPRFDMTSDRITPPPTPAQSLADQYREQSLEKAGQAMGKMYARGARPSPAGANMLQSPPSVAYTPPAREVTGDASLAEQITREQAEKEAERARDAGRYGRGARPSPAGANMLQTPIGFADPRITKSDPNLLIGGNMLQSPPTRFETVPDMSKFGMYGRGARPSTPRTLLQSMAAYHQQREDREARQAADREAEKVEKAIDAGKYGRGARPSPNAFQRALTTLMGGFQRPDKPATQPTTQGMVYGPISPDEMAMSQAAQQASKLELEDAEMGYPTEPARTSMGEGMPSKGSGQVFANVPDLSYMDTPEYQREETWESYDPYGDYSVDMSGYYALKHGGGLSSIVKKFDGGDFDYDYTASDVGLGDTFTDDFTDDRSAATYDYDAYSYGPSESETVDAPSVSSDLPDAAYMGDFAFAPDPQGRVGLMGPSEVAGVDIAQTYLSPDPESSELGQYEDVSGLERFIANLLPDSFSKTLGLSSAAQRFRSDEDLARRPGYTKEDVAFEQNLNNLQNKFRNAMVTAKADRVNETSPKKDQEEAEKEATLEAAKDIFGGSFVENKGKGAPGFLATYGLGSLFKGMGLIGTAEINGVPVHVHDDGSITVVSPENEPGYDDSLSVGSLAPEVPGVKKFKKELKKVEEETKEAAKESTVSLPSLTEGDKTRIRILMNNQGITEEEAKIRLNLQGRS